MGHAHTGTPGRHCIAPTTAHQSNAAGIAPAVAAVPLTSLWGAPHGCCMNGGQPPAMPRASEGCRLAGQGKHAHALVCRDALQCAGPLLLLSLPLLDASGATAAVAAFASALLPPATPAPRHALQVSVVGCVLTCTCDGPCCWASRLMWPLCYPSHNLQRRVGRPAPH